MSAGIMDTADTKHNELSECVTDGVLESWAFFVEWMTVVVAVETNICGLFRSDG